MSSAVSYSVSSKEMLSSGKLAVIKKKITVELNYKKINKKKQDFIST